MSGQIYEAYKVISAEQRKNLLVRVGQGEAGYYNEDGECIFMGMEPAGTSHENSFLLGNIQGWNRRVHTTVIKQHLSLRKEGVKALFEGADQIAEKTALLGLAALWQCSASGTNGCQVMDLVLSYKDVAALTDGPDFETDCELEFAPGTLGGMLKVTYIVYLKSITGKQGFGLAQNAGTRLGTITNELTVQVDGEASSFPIVNVVDNSGPLWWVNYNGEMDPFTDAFSEENICLVLNEGHPDYACLGEYNTPMFKEIFSSALEDIFRRLIEDFESDGLFENNVNAEEGSVALVVRYMADTFKLNLANEDERHRSVRKAVARQLAGGTK